MRRSRLNVRLEREQAKHLDQLAAMTGMTRPAIVTAALASFLAPEGTHPREGTTALQIDRLKPQLEHLERGQTILIETLALFIRDYLVAVAPAPEPPQEAVRPLGRARFENFIERLARHLQRGGSLVKDLEQEFAADESRFPRIDERRCVGTNEAAA